MKFQEMLGKVKQLCKRAGARTLIAACAVLILGSVIVLNFILQKETDPSDSKTKLAVDVTQDIAEEQQTSASEGSKDYFAAVSLQRKQARDEAMEVLLSVSESDMALEEPRRKP